MCHLIKLSVLKVDHEWNGHYLTNINNRIFPYGLRDEHGEVYFCHKILPTAIYFPLYPPQLLAC